MLIEYELLTDLDEIRALSNQWDELLGRSCCNRAFSSVAWYVASCLAQPHLVPCVAIVRSGATIAGILPLALNPATGEAAFPSDVSSYNDLIADSSDETLLCGLWDFAISSPKPYIHLDLKWLRENSNLARATACSECRGIAGCFELQQDVYSFVRLPCSYEDYLDSRSRLFRRNLRRARKIAAADGFTVQRLDPASFPAGEIADLFMTFHLARFGDASTFRRKPENYRFATSALPELFARRQIVVLALYRGTEIVGIDICLVGHYSLCAWNGGYPPEIEPWSPGRLLVDEGIRIAFQMGLREYDMLRGPQEWKRSWTNEVRRIGRIQIAIDA